MIDPDEKTMSYECWAEVEWNQCDITRRSFPVYSSERWAKCPKWSCDDNK